MDIQSMGIHKYPRTPHLEGSRLQVGDDASDQVPLTSLRGKRGVIEEKLDAANSAISFSAGAEMLLQSRGHYLVGGAGDRQFGTLKAWAGAHEGALLERLGDRYVMYGECMHSKHSVFYDQLAHVFCEFDILDLETGMFLSTPRRRALLAGGPVVQVPVLYEGALPSATSLLHKLIRPSLAKTVQWRSRFEAEVARMGLPLDLCWKQTDKSDLAEGLYLKVEDEDHVLGRFKFVRSSFVQSILDSGSHHSRRPIIPNRMATGVDLYSPTPTVSWEDLGLRTIRSLEELIDMKEQP